MLRHVLAPRPRASCASCPTSMSTRLGTGTEPPCIRKGSVDPSLLVFGNVLSNVIVVGGRVRGAWRRTAVARGALGLEIRLLERLWAAEQTALEKEGRRLSRFLGRPVELRGGI